MNKIARYLNEHLLGEVTGSREIRKRYATDASVLSITPEVVVFPRVTNDIRKVARFTWQLAEKGHVIGITARGLGGDTTGAAIGKGVVINLATHCNDVIQLLAKDRLIHVQPGIRVDTLAQTLKWQGLALPEADGSATIGGIIASDALGTSRHIADNVEKLEVVLANGDILETGRISKRDISKKLGTQTFEGEIYRKIEGLIEDNQEVLERIANDPTRDNTGYRRLAQVRQKDGSFDLTPLFIGSQGTLGIISEVVLRTDFYSQEETLLAITADSLGLARDVADKVLALEPAELSIIDGELYRRAVKDGVQFSPLGDVSQLGAVVYVRFNDFSERAQAHKLKKIRKMLRNIPVGIIDSTEQSIDDLASVKHVTRSVILGESDKSVVPIIDGAFVPTDRREEFEEGLLALAHKHHIDLPHIINVLSGTYRILVELKLDVVSDKQKLFKLIADYASLVDSVNGAFVNDGAEGRLKANAAWAILEDDEAKLFEQVREIFDPFSTLNPGVKQKNELRGLVASLRSSYESM